MPDLMLEDAPSDLLRGTVTDEDGNPVPNLTLMVLDENAGEETLNKVNTLVYPDEKVVILCPISLPGIDTTFLYKS
ncbi:carboxypeptidase-like regulatory domain-containing protein [Cohnella faecalis]|uniref:carboxypeptidase-like regulatory domain-containing protein n=1 Tax=Cohnella faecalis TaxID=2315694 RepID=UPI0011C213AB|nr:carboxypeptidase-like regulatory domain-containing protein [Cohnella faecalis]